MNKSLRRWRDRIRHWPHPWRIVVGILLLLFGLVGFLPVVGFWMIPLGLLVLSIDFPLARRAYVNLLLWWRRMRRTWLRKRQH